MRTVQQIQELLISHVCEIQHLSGRLVPTNIDGDFKPIGGCQGFESLNAVEVAVQVGVILGCEIRGNPFAEDYKALTVEAIAKRLHKLQKDGARDGKR